jgi:hypothetical protein
MPSEDRLRQAMRAIALRYPEAEEGIACEGTAVEKRTIKARNKAFLFLGSADAMLKLGNSQPEAVALANSCKIGAHGWVTLQLDGKWSEELLARWIDESYRLLAPRPLVAQLDGAAVEKTPKKVPAKKKRTR